MVSYQIKIIIRAKEGKLELQILIVRHALISR